MGEICPIEPSAALLRSFPLTGSAWIPFSFGSRMVFKIYFLHEVFLDHPVCPLPRLESPVPPGTAWLPGGTLDLVPGASPFSLPSQLRGHRHWVAFLQPSLSWIHKKHWVKSLWIR